MALALSPLLALLLVALSGCGRGDTNPHTSEYSRKRTEFHVVEDTSPPPNTSVPTSGDSSEWTEFHVVEDPSLPPKRPPTSRLVLEGQGRDGQQTGVLVSHYWTVDGKTSSFEMPAPVTWPPATEARSDQAVLLDLGTPITPALVDVQWYRDLDLDGVPTGEAIVLSCTVFTASSDDCDLGVPLDKRRDLNWQLVIPLPSHPGDYFIGVSVLWWDTSASPEDFGLPYLASWVFFVTRI